MSRLQKKTVNPNLTGIWSLLASKKTSVKCGENISNHQELSLKMKANIPSILEILKKIEFAFHTINRESRLESHWLMDLRFFLAPEHIAITNVNFGIIFIKFKIF